MRKGKLRLLECWAGPLDGRKIDLASEEMPDGYDIGEKVFLRRDRAGMTTTYEYCLIWQGVDLTHE